MPSAFNGGRWNLTETATASPAKHYPAGADRRSSLAASAIVVGHPRRELYVAVAKAYGWDDYSADTSDEEILGRLLKLDLGRTMLPRKQQ